MEKEDQSCDVCIVCALPEETRAFLEVVEKQCDTTFQERISPRYQYGYFATTITNHKGEFLHLHLSWLPRRGPQEMVRHLHQAVEEYQPRIVFMTGICAGDAQAVQLGDLVAAERVFTYDTGAYTRDEQGRIVHEHDTLTYQPDARLLQYLGMFNRWESLVGSLERPVSLLHQFNRNQVRCYIKPMASGSAARADNPFKDIQAPVRGTVAIDLESQALGFVLSDRPHPIPWLVVKGVYNYADPETQEDNTYRDFAARASALYALSCIQNYVTLERVPLHPSVGEQAKFENFPPRNDYFTGREVVLQELHETLNKKQGAILTYAISGMGGIGKTQTAIEYAFRYRDDYETVLWVAADSRETIHSGFRDIAKKLRVPKINTRTSLQKVMSAVRGWLESHQKWLLIFDNVDKPNEVLDLLLFSRPLQGRQHMLLTTRDKELSRQMNIERIEIDVMNEDEGSLFLLRKARKIVSIASINEASESDRSVAREIVKVLGGLPLALDQAGAYIDSVGISLSKYLERYKEFQIELLKRYEGKPPDYGWTVATTWGLSFSKIIEANPTAIELLRLFAFLDPDAIPVEMITKGIPIWGPELEPLSSDVLRMDEIRAILLRFSLIRSNDQTEMLTIHRLVQAVILDNMGEELRYTWAERAIRVVDHAFPRQINKVETWEQCRRCQPHAEACARLIKDYTFGFLASVEILNQLAYYLREQASYKEAETYFQQALSICEQFGHEDYRDIIINNLARLYFDTYRYKKAASFYEQALAMREQVRPVHAKPWKHGGCVAKQFDN